MISKLLLFLINICHIALIAFIVLAPFFGSNYLLVLHAIIVPFIILHWILNNNMCALTLAEQAIREKMSGKPVNKDECFTCKLIEPIYDFKMNNEEMSTLIYVITIGLWLTSVGKLFYGYKTGKITSFRALFET